MFGIFADSSPRKKTLLQNQLLAGQYRFRELQLIRGTEINVYIFYG
ncbi:MAG: hypothetical protein F6K58_19995 [Symploca sp. SIO2E9]|nr:hypothetical protein [Symploca sp. SIO2E9]